MSKRKAAGKLSGLVEDEEDEMLFEDHEAHNQEEAEASPPAKRQKGRPKGAATRATGSNSTTRKPRSTATAETKRRAPPKRGAKTAQKSIHQSIEPPDTADNSFSKGEGENEGGVQDDDEAPALSSEDELDSPKTTKVATKDGSKTSTRSSEMRESLRRVTADGEFVYTPTGSRKDKQQAVPRASLNESSAEPLENNETAEEIDETTFPEDSRAIQMASPSKNSRGTRKQSYTTAKRRGMSVSDAENGDTDITLRRKLGEMTQKYENMEKKYRNLREIGVVEAGANVEKLRKQCEATTAGMVVAFLKWTNGANCMGF